MSIKNGLARKPHQGVLAAACAMLLASSAWSASSDIDSVDGILSAGTHDIYYRGVEIPRDGMEELRGGFNLAGMKINFGAKLTTLINNGLRYETEITFSGRGPEVISRGYSGPGAGGVVTLVGPGQAISASDIAGNVDLSGLGDFSGVVVNYESGGMLAALHRVTRKAIISTLATDASGQSVDNRVDISMHIGNLGELRAARQRTMILNSLQGVPR
ncbi:hypothetical protein ACFPTY_17290 [Halomonas beimenensis]|uniref:Uncharacterized protein n=1 Tax=Halomonas beimenensis TaxID=475662 RepID=A0A291PCZ9_9GAMM|nr:hypothetical protein [Halomonas beimenensis]ATJ84783.1 hypothetical protein BEI_3796 [Halomonas beimenensis]